MGWIVRARSGRWQARWRDPAGREQLRTFRLKEDAERFLRDVERAKDRGDYRDPKLGREALLPYLERSLARADADLRPATRALYRVHADRYVLPALGGAQLAAIRPSDVADFVAGMQRAGAGAATIQVAHRLLSRVLAEAVSDGIIAANPAARIRKPRVERKAPRVLSVAELEHLAAAIAPRYTALVLVAGYGGLRFGEAAALRRRSVRILERRVDVTEALSEVRGQVEIGPPKTAGSARSVTVPPSIAAALGEHMGARMRPAAQDRAGADLIFTDPGGGPIRRTNWRRRVWEPAVTAAELDPRPNPHDLRHTAAALAIAAGAHPKAIQARLGHGSIRTTLDLYGHLFPALDAELADRLEEARAVAALEAAGTGAGTSGAVVAIGATTTA